MFLQAKRQESPVIDNLEIVQKFSNAVKPGAIVECGTWRGGMLGAIGMLLGPECEYVGADSFQGLPKASDIDGKAAQDWQEQSDGEGYFDNCTASRAEFDRAMSKAKLSNVRVLEGWFDETLPLADFPQGIGLLRLDGDWYDSTMTCLSNLFPKVVKGGVIIIDDYAAWDGCSRAVHKYLADHSAVERLRTWNGRVYYMIKQ